MSYSTSYYFEMFLIIIRDNFSDFYKVLLTDGFLILSNEQLDAYKDYDAYGQPPPLPL